MKNDFARAIVEFEHSDFEYNERENEELLTNNNSVLIEMEYLTVAEMESTIARNWNKSSKIVVVRAAIRALANVLTSRIKKGQIIEQKNENYIRWCMRNDKEGAIIGVAAESLCKIVEAKMCPEADYAEKTPDWQFLYTMDKMLNNRTNNGLMFYRGRDEEFKIYDRLESIILACKDSDIVVPSSFETNVKNKINQLGKSSDQSGSSYKNDSAEEYDESQSQNSYASSSVDEDEAILEERKGFEDRIRRGELFPKAWRDAIFDIEIEPYIDKLSGYDVERNKLKKWYYESDQSKIKPKIVAANVQLMVDFGRKKRIMTEGFKKYISSEEGWNDSLLTKSFQNCYADDSIDFDSQDMLLPTLALAGDKCRDDSEEKVLDPGRATILVSKSTPWAPEFGGDLDEFAQHSFTIPGINALVHGAPLFQEECGESVLVPDAFITKKAMTYHAFDPRGSIAVNYLCAPIPLFDRNWYLGTGRVRFTDSSPYIDNKCISDVVLKLHNIDTPDSISFISSNDEMSPAARKMLLEQPNVYSLEELSYDRKKIAEKINEFTAPRDGAIGFPDPVLKASDGSVSRKVWMLNAGEGALSIADRILALDKAGLSSILEERMDSIKISYETAVIRAGSDNPEMQKVYDALMTHFELPPNYKDDFHLMRAYNDPPGAYVARPADRTAFAPVEWSGPTLQSIEHLDKTKIEGDSMVRPFVSPDRDRKPVVTGMYVDEIVYDNATVDADPRTPLCAIRRASHCFVPDWVKKLAFEVDPNELEKQIEGITIGIFDGLTHTIDRDQAPERDRFRDYNSLMGPDLMFRPVWTVRSDVNKVLYDDIIIKHLPQDASSWIFTDKKTGNPALRMRPAHRKRNGWIILPVQQGAEQEFIQLSDSSQEIANGSKWDSIVPTVIEVNGPRSFGHDIIRELSSQLSDDDENVKKWGRGENVRLGQLYGIAGLATQEMQNQRPSTARSLLMFKAVTVPSLAEPTQRGDSLPGRSEGMHASNVTSGIGTDSRIQSEDRDQSPPLATENDSSLQQLERNDLITSQSTTSASWAARVLSSCCILPKPRSGGGRSNHRS